MQPLTLGKRVFVVGDIYGNAETPSDSNFGDRIVTDAGIAGETRAFDPASTSEGERVEVVYVQFDQPDGTNIPDRHTSRWVPRMALCTSRFGHVCHDVGKPCVFCGYQPPSNKVEEEADPDLSIGCDETRLR